MTPAFKYIMKIFTSKQIREIDAYTISNEPISSVDLMERAAAALSVWFMKKFSKKTKLVFIAGRGNNGGDAWALARILYKANYNNIRFYLLGEEGQLSPDSQVNRQRLIEETSIQYKQIKGTEDFPFLSKKEWLVDALFGSGLTRPLDGIAADLVTYINSCDKAGVVSIDIPSGLLGEENDNSSPKAIVQANYTLAFEFPKWAFFMTENENYVGDWQVLPIGLHKDIISSEVTNSHCLVKRDLKEIIHTRSKFTHKGSYGHALIVAGSYGMMGAAVLAVKSAVSGGAGLVTAHIPRLGYGIMQTSVPESLISLDESDLMFTEVNHLEKYSAIAIGPGINTKTNTVRGLKQLLEKTTIPIVIDADALNILSENKEWLEKLPNNTIITPHPGEFDRLTQKHSSHSERVKTQIVFAQNYQLIVVLKGAHTSIVLPTGELWFNTTGNPGMATGGSGDILTGMLCAFIAQGYTTAEASKLAVYVHGLAGDLACKKQGYHALCASDIIKKLGKALKKLEKK